MITDKDKVVKVSFYVPVNYDQNIYADGVRRMICNMFGSFNVYELQTKETTLEAEYAKQK